MQLQVAVLHIAVCCPEKGYHINPFCVIHGPHSGQLLYQVLAELVAQRNLAIVLYVHTLLRVALYLLLNEHTVDNLTDCAQVYRYYPVAIAPACSLDDDEPVATLLHYCAAWSLDRQYLFWYCHYLCIGCKYEKPYTKIRYYNQIQAFLEEYL